MKPHPEARDLVARINDRNAQLIEQADAAASKVLQALLLVAVAALGGYFLAEYFTPCETAAHLCMAVVGLQSRRREDTATPPSPLQMRVMDAISAAREAGELDGHMLGYIEGTRRGMVTGLCWGLVAGVLLIVGALKAGLLVGYL